jgi:putative peptidoglycan lipid II flippase
VKIFKSAFVITFFSIIARILGFVRDSLIAKYAGVGVIADVFFASFKITNFFRKILAEGSFFAAFVPSFAKILDEKGKVELSIFSSSVFSIMFYVVLLITLIFQVFMEPITAFTSPGFLSDNLKFLLTVEVSRILFWYFMLIVGSSILCGLLNSVKKFSYYAIVPVFLNVSLIIFIVFFQNSFKTFAHTLAYGVLVGGAFQFGIAYFGCVKQGFKLRIYASPTKLFNAEVLKTFRKMFPAMIAGGLSQINTLIDLILGSLIVSGVSYLYFVDRIFYLPTASIGTAIGIVVLPMLSAAVGKKNISDVKAIQTESLNISSLLVLPVSFALIFCADIFVSVTFERGNFTHENTQIVGNCLKILGFALPFVVYMKIFSSIFFSHENTKTPMYIALICATINASISIILMKFIGIYGIIIGSSISYFADAVITFHLLKKQNLINLDWKALITFNVKIFFASLVFGLFCYLFFVYWGKTNYYGNIFEESLLIKFLYLGLISLAGIFVYYLILKITKIDIKKLLR